MLVWEFTNVEGDKLLATLRGPRIDYPWAKYPIGAAVSPGHGHAADRRMRPGSSGSATATGALPAARVNFARGPAKLHVRAWRDFDFAGNRQWLPKASRPRCMLSNASDCAGRKNSERFGIMLAAANPHVLPAWYPAELA